MNQPYTNLHMEPRQATQRLIEVTGTECGPGPVEIEDIPVGDQQKITDRPALSRELTRECKTRGDFWKTRQSAKESDWSEKDMSSFSFTLTLLLSGTIAAANADHPLFWLLIGPTPLAIGLAAAVFLRPRLDLSACLLRKR